MKDHDLLHNVEEFIEEEEHKLVRFFKKAAIIMIALFMIGLMFSFVIPFDTVISLLSSTPLTEDPPDYVAVLNNATIIITADAHKILLSKYFAEQKHEFKACLTGTKETNLYTVSGIYFPRVSSQSFRHVSAESCNNNTIIDLHTHPYLSCIFSDQDLRSLDYARRTKPDMIMALMCKNDRFNFYGY